MEEELEALKRHFRVRSKSEVIIKGLSALKVIQQIKDENGELIAKKSNKELHLVIT